MSNTDFGIWNAEEEEIINNTKKGNMTKAIEELDLTLYSPTSPLSVAGKVNELISAVERQHDELDNLKKRVGELEAKAGKKRSFNALVIAHRDLIKKMNELIEEEG